MSRYTDIRDTLEVMPQSELLEHLRKVVTDPTYRDNQYSDMMHDILERGPPLTKNQRNAVEVHLQKHAEVWF